MPELTDIDFVTKLKELHKRGFIKSLRKHNTGIGYTLEEELGIKENNLGDPDFSFNGIPVELKAHRSGAQSRITLITKTPKWSPLSQKEIIKRFGYADLKGRQGLKITLTATESYNAKGFRISLNKKENRLNIVHKDFGVVCYYEIEELMARINKKLYENLMLVIADSKTVDDEEYFKYKKAILLTNLSEEQFEKLVEQGLMVWEFRAHIKPSGVVRDHGPGFRISQLHIAKLYDKQKVIFDASALSEE